MIAFCLPSRGLIFSRTVESIIFGMGAINQKGIGTSFHISHDKPIPDSHNSVVAEALENLDVKKIILMEEDNFLFPDAFIELAQAKEDVYTVQYNDKNGSPHGIIHYNEAQEVLWAGLGSVAIKRKVFEALGDPYFRTNVRYKNVKKRRAEDGKLITVHEAIKNRTVWDDKENRFVEAQDNYKYGGLDIDFYTRVRAKGFSIGVSEKHKGHHFELVKLGEKHTNNGIHTIKQV